MPDESSATSNQTGDEACIICTVCLFHTSESFSATSHPNRYNPRFDCVEKMLSHQEFDRHLAVIIVKRWCERRLESVNIRLEQMGVAKVREFKGSDGSTWTSKKILEYKAKIQYKLAQANIDAEKYKIRGITRSIAEIEFDLKIWFSSDLTLHSEVDTSNFSLEELLPTRQRVLERPITCAECGTTTRIEAPNNPCIALHHRGDVTDFLCWNSHRELTFADLVAANTGWDGSNEIDTVYRMKDGRVMTEYDWEMYGQNGFDEWDRSDPNTA